ncbi:hypothetical protein H4218_004740 [Coemansia sp. IMI 209128]|nr:hypothetical protein H4218_004740 [Coemansia sp. IMI 209128]
MTDGAEPKSQGFRDAITSKLRLGKGGHKAKRGSTPRTSAIEAMHLASNPASSHGSHGGSLESLSLRLRKLREAGDLAEQPPFRIKFVNHKNEATMADIYPTEEYKDIIRKVVEKLRMPHIPNYVLMYTDTDAEEIGVACTDNLREMFSIFEPGSKLQLKIVQQTINNSGALDSIPSIWDNGHTPNVFLHDDASSSHSSESSVSSVDLGKLQAAAAAAVEMEEKPKPSHVAVEDVAEAAVAAAAASAAAAALADAVGTKAEKQENSNASNKAEPPTPVSPASPVVSPKADKPEEKPDELRTAIAMMSNNLTLAIESLGTKLATNFDRLSNEQAKIIDSLAHAKTTVSTKVESKDSEEKVETKTETTDAGVAAAAVAAAAAVVAKAAESDSDSDSDSDDEKKKVEVKTEVKVEAKAEEKVETKAEEKVETKTETKTEVKVEETKTEEKVEIKVEEKVETKTDECATETRVEETKTTEIKVEDVVPEKKKEEPPAPACDAETITVEVIEPPAPAPTPIHVHLKKDECEEQRRADIFKEHLHNANAFAFHTNPYASSFFQHGFSEVGMPSYIRHPCMLQTPFDEHACDCSGGCSACLTRKLAEMGYGVNEMQVSSLLCVYNGDTARVIDHVTSC